MECQSDRQDKNDMTPIFDLDSINIAIFVIPLDKMGGGGRSKETRLVKTSELKAMHL